MCALGPLRLIEECSGAISSIDSVLNDRGDTICIAADCEKTFKLPEERQALLQHFLTVHKLVIADVDKIALLKDYIQFWKAKFSGRELSEYCSTLLADTIVDEKLLKDQKYYLLSDVLPIDNELRKNLQKRRLESILEHQRMEREDQSYERECLFCRTIVKGSRSDFLTHLFEKHNFYIAKLENLVFTGDLIEYLNDKLTNCICIYCEKVFKDRVILKEHMRKKAHKRINPKNNDYDKFFISNYLELGRNWQTYMKSVNKKKTDVASGSKARDSSSDSDGNWSDWDETDALSVLCLFCKHSEGDYSNILGHMSSQHSFDFRSITKSLNFYERLKLVNYIRRQVYLNRCVTCDCERTDNAALLSHMSDNKHFSPTDSSLWNQPEFYFSTYEDDSFLYCLEDDEEDSADIVRSTEEMHISQQVALSVIK